MNRQGKKLSSKPTHVDITNHGDNSNDGGISPLQMSPFVQSRLAARREAEELHNEEMRIRGINELSTACETRHHQSSTSLASSIDSEVGMPPPPPARIVCDDMGKDQHGVQRPFPLGNKATATSRHHLPPRMESPFISSANRPPNMAETTHLIPGERKAPGHGGTCDTLHRRESSMFSVPAIVRNEVAAYEDRTHYDWTEFYKADKGLGFVTRSIRFLRWIATGRLHDLQQSDDEIQDNLNCLARLLSLLREYHDRFGMPVNGGPKDQEFVLREVTKDLYLGGAPIWVLDPVLKTVAEGLTGRTGIDFYMMPRRTFIFDPNGGGTRLIRTVRGYDMQRLDAMEKIAVRLASFASNTSSTSSIPARFPHPSELREAYRTESVADCLYSQVEMEEEILTNASEAEGLFFYINAQHEPAFSRDNPSRKSETDLGEFWRVEDNIKELFSRLAAREATANIDKIDTERKELYSSAVFSVFRFLASASACAFWFGGSWLDIVVSGVLAVVVAFVGSTSLLTLHERIIFEAVAGFFVGTFAGVIAITFPQEACFGAMAISGVLDLLQGFRVVYAIIEVMSRHTVAGGADFLEGILFTALIAYFLKFGELAAVQLLGEPDGDAYLQCNKGIDPRWHFIFVIVGCVSWSGLFNPHYLDLPVMAGHGILGYLVSQQFTTTPSASNVNIFVASALVTLSAGLMSRFTGRQALGNTIAGIYVLLPGAYMVNEVYQTTIENFISTVVLRAIIIGIGAWTGTILCSPTMLGTNRGFIQQVQVAQGARMMASNNNGSSIGRQRRRRREKSGRRSGGTLLFF